MSSAMFLTITCARNIVKHYYAYCQKHFEMNAVRENVSAYMFIWPKKVLYFDIALRYSLGLL